jgi:multiple sugar transport system permease protein
MTDFKSKIIQMLTKYKKRLLKISWSFVRLFFLAGLSFIILYPFYLMISSSFLSRADMLDTSVFLIPKNFSVFSFHIADLIIGYWKSLFTSTVLTVTITIIQTFVCIVTGYGFGRFNFPGKNIFFALVIFTFVVPPQLYMASLYLRFRFFDIFGLFSIITGNPLNMINEYTPMYLLALTGNGIKNGLFIYIFRQNFRNMPRELEEAAYVDGAGTIKIFSSIMVPNVIATIITVVLFSFVWQYNDAFYSGLFLTSPDLLPLKYMGVYNWDVRILPSLGISDVDGYNPVFVNSVRSAAALMIMTPVILVYIFSQRFFVQSVERAGIVG